MTVNADRPNGFVPIGTMSGSPWNGYVRYYECDAGEGTAIFIGDAVTLEADGKVAPAAAGEVVLGVCVGVPSHIPTATNGSYGAHFLSSSSPDLKQNYSPASTAGVIAVAIGPDVLYEVQEDGDTDPIAFEDIGSNVDLVATHAGSTTTGRSGQEIDSDSHTAGTAQFRLVGFVDRPDNEQGDVDSLASNDNARWIVRINENHFTVIDDGGTVEGAEGI